MLNMFFKVINTPIPEGNYTFDFVETQPQIPLWVISLIVGASLIALVLLVKLLVVQPWKNTKKTFEVKAVVTEKYIKENCLPLMAAPSIITWVSYNHYYLTLTAGDKMYETENEYMYDKAGIGDELVVEVTEVYDRHKLLKKTNVKPLLYTIGKDLTNFNCKGGIA